VRGIVGIERQFSLPSFSRLSRDELVAGRDGVTSTVCDLLLQRAPSMRLPFFDPPREEVAAVASDLIMRFGLLASDEAMYLAALSEQMRARSNRQLYRLAAREIETSFAEARRRLNVESAPEATG
jgi:hypothetical protein